jgi:hypothetical protein
VVLARLEEDPIAGPDHVDRAAAPERFRLVSPVVRKSDLRPVFFRASVCLSRARAYQILHNRAAVNVSGQRLA